MTVLCVLLLGLLGGHALTRSFDTANYAPPRERVLLALRGGARHATEIARLACLTLGAVYPVLIRLQREGLIEKIGPHVEGRGARVTYHLIDPPRALENA